MLHFTTSNQFFEVRIVISDCSSKISRPAKTRYRARQDIPEYSTAKPVIDEVILFTQFFAQYSWSITLTSEKRELKT